MNSDLGLHFTDDSFREFLAPTHFAVKASLSPDKFSAGAIGSQSSALVPSLAPSDSVAELMPSSQHTLSSPLQGNAELSPDAQRLLAAIRLIVDFGLTSSNYDSSMCQSLQSDHIDGQQHDGEVTHSLSAYHQQQFADPKLLIIVPLTSTVIGKQICNEDNAAYNLDSFGLNKREPKQPSKMKFDQSSQTGNISSSDANIERNNDHVRSPSRR
ncbi:hypothetical protein CPB84DRAFT_1795348 [Gymnopilus junonius]|uniref:Uncharacterized protein n=1 Tax=Gymnopilus junonius TaxID=109634 RepID=A0A9P5NCS6_GYMJU|nr:hypothetical protein CPB84DRAFT_1795348 [Gymnopilus junonius]